MAGGKLKETGQRLLTAHAQKHLDLVPLITHIVVRLRVEHLTF